MREFIIPELLACIREIANLAELNLCAIGFAY